MKKKLRQLIAKLSKSKSIPIKHKKLEKKIDYVFRNRSLLASALTHTSHPTKQDSMFSFERMEFLGDAILGLITSEVLFTDFPNYEEGDLSKLKSKIVSRKFLTLKAQELNLKQYLTISNEIFKSRGKKLDTVLSNSMESLICSIYLDGGLSAVSKFIRNFILDDIQKSLKNEKLKNYKSLLQEYTQAEFSIVPQYHKIKEIGPEHMKTFTIEVIINDVSYGIGKGTNKKEAEQFAAMEACKKLKLK